MTVATAGGISANTVCAMGFDGTQYLFVYLQIIATATSSNVQLSGEFLSTLTGAPAAAPFLIAPVGGNQSNPALAFDGTNYLVTWEESTSNATMGLNAARVSTLGVVLDPVPISVYSEQGAPLGGYQWSYPAVAFDGTNYLVVYRDARALPSAGTTVSAARISPAGALLDGSATSPGILVTTDKSQDIGTVNVAVLGGQYWLMWELGEPAQLYGAQLSTAGVVTSPGADGYPIATDGTNTAPLLVANAQSALLGWDTQNNLGKFGVSAQLIFPLLP